VRKLVLKMSVSVDGFVGGPNGEIDWIFGSLDEAANGWMLDTLWDAGVHIMGSRTFRDMKAYWPSSSEPFAAPMNQIPKIAFSRTRVPDPDRASSTTRALADATRVQLAEGSKSGSTVSSGAVSWTDAPMVSGDLAEEIARLKQEPGKPILAHGGASFAQSLVGLGLVDEYRLLVHPVALGTGLALFSNLARPLDLTLLSTTRFGTGAVAHVYRSA